MTGFEELRELARIANEMRSSGGYLPTFRREPLDTWLTRAVAKIERETLPRPLFEDGEPVQFGDEILCSDGQTITVSAIEAKQSGWYSLRQFSRDALETIRPGEPVKRPEPTDTWERLERDVDTGSGFYDMDKAEAMEEVLRRCKALAGVE